MYASRVHSDSACALDSCLPLWGDSVSLIHYLRPPVDDFVRLNVDEIASSKLGSGFKLIKI